MLSDDRESNTKIFVGNVPFQCDEDEFKKCFKDIPGFISAEIIPRHNSFYSRGFGFVTLETEKDAQNLLHRNDIMFKDRILRFTGYKSYDKNKIPKRKNYLFIKNIPKEMNREQLKNIFSTLCPIGACFINTNIKTGESKGNAIIEVKDDHIYENLIKNKIFQNNDQIFEILRWKNKSKIKPFKNKKINPEEIYRNAFNAGVNVGRLEAIKIKLKN